MHYRRVILTPHRILAASKPDCHLFDALSNPAGALPGGIAARFARLRPSHCPPDCRLPLPGRLHACATRVPLMAYAILHATHMLAARALMQSCMRRTHAVLSMRFSLYDSQCDLSWCPTWYTLPISGHWWCSSGALACGGVHGSTHHCNSCRAGRPIRLPRGTDGPMALSMPQRRPAPPARLPGTEQCALGTPHTTTPYAAP